MKISPIEAELYLPAIAALKECLEAIPTATVVVRQNIPLTDGKQVDIAVEVTNSGRRTTLIAELKKSGEPQLAQTAINQINIYRHGYNAQKTKGLFIAPYISKTTAKLCQDEDISYLDLAGNCHIEFHGVYIHIEGKPNPFAHSRSLVSLYRPKAERVLRVLLTQPSQPWRIQALANEAQVSIGQAFKVKEMLLKKDWIEETERGISLTSPRELLAAWAEQYRVEKHKVTQFYTLLNFEDFEKFFSAGCRQREILCAFTSFTAAAKYAPYANYQRITAYTHYELAEVQELLSQPILQLAKVDTGANVILLSPYDDGVFYGVRQQQEISLASPLQTYLDLQGTGGRGREAAEVLLQKESVPNW